MDFASVALGREPEPEQALVVVQPMDLESVKQSLKATYDDQINNLVALAESHEVTDEGTEKKAIEIAGQAKTFLKRMDEERKRIIQEPGEFVSGVNKLVKVFKDRVLIIESGLKKKVGDFQWKKELDRRKREKEALEAARKLQEQVKEEAKAAGVEAPVVIPAPVEKKETVTRADSGASAHIRMQWTYKIINESKIPREYLIPNERKIKASINAGTRNIDGLEIFEEPVTVLKS